MSLTKEEVLHLAKLARLQLSQAEADNYAKQLDSVLHYLAKLGELSGQPQVKPAPATAAGRVDEVEPFAQQADLWKSAPARDGNWWAVPPVFTDNK